MTHAKSNSKSLRMIISDKIISQVALRDALMTHVNYKVDLIMIKKSTLLSAFLVSLIISGVVLAGTMHLGAAQNSTAVNGIINSNATWTKADSPYALTGPVLVNNGVTLTIQPGVTVDLGSYYIVINGTIDLRRN